MPTLTRPAWLGSRAPLDADARDHARDHARDDADRVVDDRSDGPDATDPRFRARRADVLRARLEGRRRLVRSVLGAVTAVAVVIVGLNSALVDVDDVLVHGAVHTTAAEIAAATGIVPGTPLVDVDPGAATAAVEALPWVLSAAVERSWWGTVEVTVTERTPFARVVGGTGAPVLADASGRVLSLAEGPAADPAADLASDLVTIESAAAAAPGGQLGPAELDAAAVGGSLTPGVRSRLERVRVGPDATMTLALRNGVTVLWGAADRNDAKLRSLTTVLGQVDLAGLCTIDVRVPSTPVSTRDC